MERSEIESKIAELKLTHQKITATRRKSNSDQEEVILYNKHKAILREISTLDWGLKSSEEKNEYRKAVISMGEKWSNMKGSIKTENDDFSKLQLVVSLCDVALALLKEESLDSQLKEKLEELVALIDSKRVDY